MCGKTTYVNKHFNNSLIINEKEFIDIEKTKDRIINSQEESITIDGLNNFEQNRNAVIETINNLLNKKIEIKYLYFDIPKYKMLYKCYKEKQLEKSLPIHMYYSLLDVSSINPNDITKVNDLEFDYDKLYNGCSSVVVDIRNFFVGLTQNQTINDLPKNLSLVKPNNKLIELISIMRKRYYNIYFYFHETNCLSCWTYEEVFKLSDHIIKEYNLPVPISGSYINISKDIKYHKPNPWTLFEIFNSFGINPGKTLFVGSSDIDKQFAENSGINHYINAGSVRQLNKYISLLEPNTNII